MSEQVFQGTVARIIRNRGFAFLTGADGTERFFHRSSVRPWVNFDNLAEGDAITFEEDRSPKGPRAKNIDLGEVSERRPNDSAPKAAAQNTAAATTKTNRAFAVEDRTRETQTESRTRPRSGGAARGIRTR